MPRSGENTALPANASEVTLFRSSSDGGSDGTRPCEVVVLNSGTATAYISVRPNVHGTDFAPIPAGFTERFRSSIGDRGLIGTVIGKAANGAATTVTWYVTVGN